MNSSRLRSLAGPAGIELACTLGDLLPLWYEDLGGDGDEIRVALVNRSGELLKGDINSQLRCSVKRSLRQRGVELLFDAAVTEILPDRMKYQQGATKSCLKIGTIVWTAGTAPNPLLMDLAIDPKHRDRRGRLMVMPTLQMPGFSEVFAAGDGATATAWRAAEPTQFHQALNWTGVPSLLDQLTPTHP